MNEALHTLDLTTWLGGQVWVVMLLFARVGSFIMLTPGFGEPFVMARARLIIALILCGILVGPLATYLPEKPADLGGVIGLLLSEALIGVMAGGLLRLLLSTLDIAGHAISLQTGLSNATVVNPAMATQGSVVGALLSVGALCLIFVSGAHHLMLKAIAQSYASMPPGMPLELGDMAKAVQMMVARCFEAGLSIAAPFLVIGIAFNVALGILSRLMPQLQVFFIAMPLQILFGLFAMTFMMGAVYKLWFTQFATVFGLLGVAP